MGPLKITEKALQRQLEGFLRLTGYRFTRIPDKAYESLKREANGRGAGAVHARAALKQLTGVPDLIVYKKTGDLGCNALMLELKVGKNDTSDEQKDWLEYGGGVVIRSFEQAQEVLRLWDRR